jgi:hypothetical protein
VKAVVIGEGSGATMDEIMAVYPRHKAVVEGFVKSYVIRDWNDSMLPA